MKAHTFVFLLAAGLSGVSIMIGVAEQEAGDPKTSPVGAATLAPLGPVAAIGDPLAPDPEMEGHVRCAMEAEMLTEPIEVRETPALDAPIVVTLEVGHSIYRCGEKNGWFEIMYPRVGEYVDCEQRAEIYQCPTGWVAAPFQTKRSG